VDFVSKALSKRGAKVLMPVGKADDAAGETEEDFMTWRDDFFTFFRQELHFEEGAMQYEPTLLVEEHSLASTDLYLGNPAGQHRVLKAASANSSIESIPIRSSRELFTSSLRNCVHMEFDLTQHPQMRYKTSDHIAIWPINPEGEVDTILRVLGISDRRSAPISIRPVEQFVKVKIPSPTTIEAPFKYYLEVCPPVSRDTLFNLVQFAPNKSAKRFLRALSSDKLAFADYLSRTHLILGRLLKLAVDSDPAVT
jgi:NADPH-ferrihemoprotein reductase